MKCCGLSITSVCNALTANFGAASTVIRLGEKMKKPTAAQQSLQYGKTNSKEVPVSRHIPYSHHIDATTLATTDGVMMKIIALKGFAHETADQRTINLAQEKRNQLLIGINDTHYALWWTIVRRKENAYPGGEFKQDFCNKLNAAYREKMSKKAMFVNEIYLTIIRKGSNNKITKLGDFIKSLSTAGDVEAQLHTRKEELRELEEVTEKVLASLTPYEPRLLEVKETDQGLESELLSFLALLINGDKRRMLIPKQSINSYLGNVRPFFGIDALELKGLRNNRIGGAITIKEYPGITKPSIFNELLTLPFEFVLTQSFVFKDRAAALEEMRIQKRRLEAAGDAAESLAKQIKVAMDDLASGRICYGLHHFTLMCYAKNIQELQKVLSKADSALSNQAINAVREDTALEAGFWAQLPGNMGYIGRKAGISSQNYASFCSGHNYPTGQKSGNRWGEALTILETVSGTHYYFNYHVGDLGNATVIGPSGSGKTVLMTFLSAMLEKYEARRVYLDKDRGAELFIRAIGGTYSIIEPGTNTGFNPFQLKHTKSNEAFLIKLVAFMCSENGSDLTATDMENIVRLVKGNFDLEQEHRHLTVLAEYLPQGYNNHLAQRLKRWYGNGDLAWLFGGETDSFPEDMRTIGYDLTHILDEPIARGAALRYLFHNIENLIDGTPISITLDEGWSGLEDSYVAKSAFNWEKTLRKRNGKLIFGSQSARDLAETRIGTTIIEQSPTQIFYPNPDADYASHCQAFSLTDKEFDLIKNRLDPADRTFLIKHGTSSIVAKLDLNGMDDYLAILSGREETVRLLDEIREEVGDNPKDWLPIFHARRK